MHCYWGYNALLLRMQVWDQDKSKQDDHYKVTPHGHLSVEGANTFVKDSKVTFVLFYIFSSLLIFVFFFKKLSLFFSPLLLVFPLPLMLFLYPHNLAFPYLIHPWLCKTPSYLTSGVPTTKNYTFPLFCLNVHENTSIHSYIYTNKHTLLHV